MGRQKGCSICNKRRPLKRGRGSEWPNSVKTRYLSSKTKRICITHTNRATWCRLNKTPSRWLVIMGLFRNLLSSWTTRTPKRRFWRQRTWINAICSIMTLRKCLCSSLAELKVPSHSTSANNSYKTITIIKNNKLISSPYLRSLRFHLPPTTLQCCP